MRRRTLITALLAGSALLVGAAAFAHKPRPWPIRPPPPRANFSVMLEGAGGERLRTFAHGGQTWVLGEQGDRYVIVVNNPTSERVEAVVSVDGRDAITGRRGNFVTNRGYVLPPFGSVRIEGFRTSLDSVATFRFTDPSDSYSSRMGTPQNVGVIGVAFFPERARQEVARDRAFESRRPRASAAPSKRAEKSRAPSPPRSATGDSFDGPSNIGTEFGEARTSRVNQVSFERQSNSPARVITLRYDDARGLEARGIEVFQRPPTWRRVPTSGPQAFPDSRFAPPPPGR